MHSALRAARGARGAARLKVQAGGGRERVQQRVQGALRQGQLVGSGALACAQHARGCGLRQPRLPQRAARLGQRECEQRLRRVGAWLARCARARLMQVRCRAGALIARRATQAVTGASDRRRMLALVGSSRPGCATAERSSSASSASLAWCRGRRACASRPDASAWRTSGMVSWLSTSRSRARSCAAQASPPAAAAAAAESVSVTASATAAAPAAWAPGAPDLGPSADSASPSSSSAARVASSAACARAYALGTAHSIPRLDMSPKLVCEADTHDVLTLVRTQGPLQQTISCSLF